MIMHKKAEELGLLVDPARQDRMVAEELHFLHQHIEQIDVSIDGVHEELRALHTVMRQLLALVDRMVEAIERADGG